MTKNNYICIILIVIGWLSILSGFIIQIAIFAIKFNVIITGVFYLHWSLWLYLGIIPTMIGYIFYK
jgi:hypothetical protein